MFTIGAIIGDVIGSRYERTGDIIPYDAIKLQFSSDFTDDTVCTIATMDWLNEDETQSAEKYVEFLRDWCRKYPDRGYGSRFYDWFNTNELIINDSWGNGSAMRISPISFLPEKIVKLTRITCTYTHTHKEAIRGAEAIAYAGCWASKCKNLEILKDQIKQVYPEYDVDTPIEERCGKTFSCSCKNTVPNALAAVIYSESFEDCIRKAIHMGGDTDTVAAMAGGIAGIYYGDSIWTDSILSRLPKEMLQVILKFTMKYGNNL